MQLRSESLPPLRRRSLQPTVFVVLPVTDVVSSSVRLRPGELDRLIGWLPSRRLRSDYAKGWMSFAFPPQDSPPRAHARGNAPSGCVVLRETQEREKKTRRKKISSCQLGFVSLVDGFPDYWIPIMNLNPLFMIAGGACGASRTVSGCCSRCFPYHDR
jgi:hypothetical protein